jgi:hypothetical protein
MHNDQRVTLGFALYAGDAFVRRASVTSDVVRIGCDARSHIQLDDAAAARLHALIEVGSLDDVTLVDLGHHGGTSVNGVPVRKRVLKVGDTIGVGHTRMLLERIEPMAAERIAGAVRYEANPFAVHQESVWDEAEYRVVPATPPMADDEIEDPASAVELRLFWGRSLLEVAHRQPTAPFYVGEACDWLIPADRLGADRAPLFLPIDGGKVVLLPGATGTITLPGKPAMRIDEAAARGMTSPCVEFAGAQLVALRDGMTVRQGLGDLIFEVSAVRKARRTGAAFTLAALVGGASAYVLGSLVAHAGMLAALSAFTPALNGESDDTIDDAQRILLQYYLDAAAEQEQKLRETEQLTAADPSDTEGGSGVRAKGEEGKMGDATTSQKDKRWGIAGPADNPDPHMGRAAALEMAANFGMTGLLNTAEGVDPNMPTAPWGQLTAEGRDPMNALGNMWANDYGNAYGPGGLALSGIGEGGGGTGEGIGLGDIGTIGRGSGNCTSGPCDGFGNGTGRLPRGRHARAPRARFAPVSTVGRLPPEVIQRIVRQNFGRFRYCYENGLRTDPNLQGRVLVNFVIGRDGNISNVSGSGDMPNVAVTSCITRAFYGLSFPQPDSGIVTVSYPIVLTPGG